MPNLPLIYISRGNIPSMAANSIQTMKMAAAFAKVYQPFSLIIGGPRIVRNRADFCLKKWYGVEDTSFIKKLPTSIWGTYPLPSGYIPTLYPLLTVLYLYRNRQCLMYTRTPRLIKWSARLRIPMVCEAHTDSSFPHSYCQKYISNNPFMKGMVVISSSLADFFKRYLPDEKVIVMEDGVDLKVYQMTGSKEELRAELQISMENYQHLAVFTGHLYANRGIEEILAAAKRLPQVLFLLVGGWPGDVSRRSQEILQQGLFNVRAIGFKPQNDIPKYQKAADVLLMPYSDKLDIGKVFSPLKMFEYMASGTPIVASNLPRITEVLNSDCAYLIPPQEPIALAEAIREIYANYALAQAKSQNAKERSLKYSWEERAREIQKLYYL